MVIVYTTGGSVLEISSDLITILLVGSKSDDHLHSPSSYSDSSNKTGHFYNTLAPSSAIQAQAASLTAWLSAPVASI